MKWFLALTLMIVTGLSAHAATLIYTNDVLGDIEPCGCRSNPQGGMTRKSQLIERMADKSLLQVDAGDLLFDTDVLPDALQKQAEIQAGFLLKAMDLLHHDAAVPGEKDFALGTKTFKKLISKSKIHFLAANIKSGGKNLLKAHQIFLLKDQDGKKIRVAVFGLVGDKLHWPGDLKVTSPIQAAKQEILLLKKSSDLIIAITHQGSEEDVALAQAVPGIDIIVGGHSQSFLQTPIVVGKTTIYQSSFRNQYIGVQPLKVPFTVEGHSLIGLDISYDPGTDSKFGPPMKALVDQFKKSVADFNSLQTASMTRVPSTGSDLQAHYQTFPKCAECHMKQYDFWRKTPHANALAPLVQSKQLRNLDCLRCHTVGLGEKLGFMGVNDVSDPLDLDALANYLGAAHQAKTLNDEIKLTPNAEKVTLKNSLSSFKTSFAPVQCENCHGPGGEHPFSGTIAKATPDSTCIRCHTPERAPAWYLAGKLDSENLLKKRLLITCPAGEMDPE